MGDMHGDFVVAGLRQPNPYGDFVAAELQRPNPHGDFVVAELQRPNPYGEFVAAELQQSNPHGERLAAGFANKLCMRNGAARRGEGGWLMLRTVPQYGSGATRHVGLTVWMSV
nr:hypothetical protein [uncultured Acetobacteroides sp.]